MQGDGAVKTPKLHLVLRRLHRSLAVLLLLLHFLTVSELFLNPKTETGVSVNVSQTLFLPFIHQADGGRGAAHLLFQKLRGEPITLDDDCPYAECVSFAQ